MSETARVLRFPQRWQVRLTTEDVEASARAFLETGSAECSAEDISRWLSDPDVLSSICKVLGNTANSNPRLVAERASAMYRFLVSNEGRCGLFDEAEYFLGEAARLAAACFRVLGDRDDAEAWLQRAEAGFRHTVNPGPVLAQVAYLRVTLAYDKRRFQEVLEILPSLLKSFEKFGMANEAAKTRFLEAQTLKECGRRSEAFEKYSALSDQLVRGQDPGLLGQVHVEIGACHAHEGRYEEAIENYKKGLVCLSAAKRSFAIADLKMTVGETFRLKGALSSAASAFREGVVAYVDLGMSAFAAYSRLVLAETLLALGSNREAEWEILAALPTIEELKMVPEGFAAVALLQESVRQRKTDPDALRQLREHLKANS